MSTLSSRLASATPETTRDLLAELRNSLDVEPKGEQAPIQTPNWRDWSMRGYKFGTLLRERAYLSAVESLTKPGWFWSITMEGNDYSSWSACYQRKGPINWTTCCPTAALALAAAIARAHDL